jgi:anion-transporting  ArsA/GET3 family ATPase
MIERLLDCRVIICAGAGGVGKTTTSAAIALGLAVEGRRVAVVTIDPARRLADALGVDVLGNEPQRVEAARLAGHGLEVEGELWAMTLDPRRTFDDLVSQLAADERTRDEVLGNRIYQQVAGAVAGSQEYTAIAKLYELERHGGFDAIVLDTPPSRSALDFLDAPDRLMAFLDSPLLKSFVEPSGLASRIAASGSAALLRVLTRVTGSALIDELRAFLVSIGALSGGFHERAAGVAEMLAQPTTAFVIVSSPEREPVDEALHFGRALQTRGLPFAGLVVNRVHQPSDDAIDVDDAALARKVARAVAEINLLAERDAAAIARLSAALGDGEPALIAHLDEDVHDIDGLIAIHRHLAPVSA